MKLSKVSNSSRTWQTIIVLAFDGLFFGSTNAATIAPFMLLVGFLLLAATFYILFIWIIRFVRLYGIPIRHQTRLAVFLSLMCGLMLALQSIGELSLRDVVVILPLSIIGYIYTTYVGTRKRNLDT